MLTPILTHKINTHWRGARRKRRRANSPRRRRPCVHRPFGCMCAFIKKFTRQKNLKSIKSSTSPDQKCRKRAQEQASHTHALTLAQKTNILGGKTTIRGRKIRKWCLSLFPDSPGNIWETLAVKHSGAFAVDFWTKIDVAKVADT